MDSSSSPSHPGLGGAGAETHHDEDQEMADAPSHSYIRSQFIPVTSGPASPEPLKVMETTEKPAVPGKKKGQAAAVKKAPKRSKGGTTGGPKQSKKVAKKAPASDASVNSGAEAEADGDAADSDEGDESDHGPYCICRGPDDHRFMIGCDVCEDWFHGECVGIDKDVGEHLIERFVCPNCSNRDEGIITVFKKTCGLPRCKKPARLYDGQPKEERSHFCSDEHKQLWWERCLSTLPKKKNPGSKVPEALTQGEFVAILESGLATFQDTAAGTPAVSGGDAAMSDSVEDTNGDEKTAKNPVNGLTPEQQEILAHCASERARITKEINTWHQMSHVLEWASIRRKKLIAAGLLDDAACGYDYRLDTIGARAPFEKWLGSEDGHALFDGVADGMGATALGPNVPLTADPKEICDKKRCKAHQGWFALLKRDLNLHQSQCSGVITKHLEREFNIEESARQRLARMAGAEVAGK